MRDGSRPRLLLGVLLVAIGLAYLPGLFAPFYLDDRHNIEENPRLRMAHPLDFATLGAPTVFTDPTRVVSYYSFYLNGLATGLTPWGLRAGNILLHLLNTWLAFQLFLAFLRARPPGTGDPRIPALSGAAFWGLNPANSQPVLYVVQRMTLLSTTFILLGLLLYLLGRRARGKGRWIRWALILPCLALSAFSKPLGILLPIGILLIEPFLARSRPAPSPRGGKESRQGTGAGFPLILLAVGIGAAAFLAFALAPLLPSEWNRPFSPGQRVLTEGRVLVSYASLFLAPLPGRLHFIHDPAFSTTLFTPLTTLASWAALAGTLVLAVLLRRRVPLFLLAVLWFLAFHAPEAGPFSLELFFEHRNYLPTLFPALAIGAFLAWACPPPGTRSPRPFLLLGGALFLLLAGSTAVRAHAWRDEALLLGHDRATFPASARLANLHAKELKDAGKVEEARRFVLEFLARTPAPVEYAKGRGIADLKILLGNIAFARGEFPEAARRYREALDAVHGHQAALEYLARTLLFMDDPRQALEVLDELQSVAPNWPQIAPLRGQALMMLGQNGEAPGGRP